MNIKYCRYHFLSIILRFASFVIIDSSRNKSNTEIINIFRQEPLSKHIDDPPEDTTSSVCLIEMGVCNCFNKSIALGYANKFMGKSQNCKLCAELNGTIKSIKMESRLLLGRVDFSQDIFKEMENRLDRVDFKFSTYDTRHIEEQLFGFYNTLGRLPNTSGTMDEFVVETNKHVELIHNRTRKVTEDLGSLRREMKNLTSKISSQEEHWKHVESDAEYNSQIITNIIDKTHETTEMLERSESILRLSVENCSLTEVKLSDLTIIQDKAFLDYDILTKDLSDIEARTGSYIIQSLCGSEDINTCYEPCRGEHCNKCDGPDCKGAKTIAYDSLNMSTRSMVDLQNKHNLSMSLLKSLSDVKNVLESSIERFSMALTTCEASKNELRKAGEDVQNILDEALELTLSNHSKSAEIIFYGTECLQLQFPPNTEEIVEIAAAINSSKDKIVRETEIKEINEVVSRELLCETKRIQEMADHALNKITHITFLQYFGQAEVAKVISDYQSILDANHFVPTEITQRAIHSGENFRNSYSMVETFPTRLDEIRQIHSKNELYISQASSATQDAYRFSQNTTDELVAMVRSTEENLRNQAHYRRLRNDANQVAIDILDGLDSLEKVTGALDEFEKKKIGYISLIDELLKTVHRYNIDVDSRAQLYRECRP